MRSEFTKELKSLPKGVRSKPSLNLILQAFDKAQVEYRQKKMFGDTEVMKVHAKIIAHHVEHKELNEAVRYLLTLIGVEDE